ncbi:hypothetical protein HanIR_Chr09g0426501 [Helianthus annuus]|nr:hypothetical protein HanIR_Chr09g0426501 [Helianthus annuus]
MYSTTHLYRSMFDVSLLVIPSLIVLPFFILKQLLCSSFPRNSYVFPSVVVSYGSSVHYYLTTTPLRMM